MISLLRSLARIGFDYSSFGKRSARSKATADGGTAEPPPLPASKPAHLEQELLAVKKEYAQAAEDLARHNDRYTGLCLQGEEEYDNPNFIEQTRVVSWLSDNARERLERASSEVARVQEQISLLYSHQSKKAGELEETDKLSEAEESRSIILLTDINRELISYLARHPNFMYELQSRQFEELIARIMIDYGFDVELTPATRDGGRDILAYIKNDFCTYLTFVECKKYSPPRKVGVDVVRQLYGVQQMHHATKSLIVTTSYFTIPAVEERRRFENMMDFKDYEDLVAILERYK